MKTTSTLRRLALVAGLATALAAPVANAATIQIVNLDGPLEGFNDNTATAPVGGNSGTTRGMQRINVFNRAAQIWGAILTSSVVIKVDATMDPLTPCTATSGVLGSAGPNEVFGNFGGQEFNNTWYTEAEANKQHGSDLNASVSDIRARFNSDVDNSTCLGATSWYYGLDHNEGTNIDLLAVVEHELGHGLGFLSLVNQDGTFFNGSGLSDVFTKFLYDDTQQLYWDQMTDAQRVASSINTNNLVWKGRRTHMRADSVLSKRRFVRFEGDAAIANGVFGDRQFGYAEYGPKLNYPPISAPVVLVNDGVAAPSTTDGCETPWVNDLTGKIALIDRGTCTFVNKTENAVDAGAVAVIIANNAAGVVNMAGTSLANIPTVSISQADGTALKNALLAGPVTGIIGTRPPLLDGADDQGNPLMYAPNPYQPGSSVSHFDVSAFPDVLMEPAINSSLTDNVDMTKTVMEDIGWFPRVLSVDTPASASSLRLDGGAPNPFRVQTSIRYQLAKGAMTEMGIYDVEGRLVKRVMNKAWLPAGAGAIVWDATNDAGARVAPGVYLYRMNSGTESLTQRVVVGD